MALPFEILVASPLVVALVLTSVTDGRRAVRGLLRGFLHWRVGWRWYALALGLPPALALLCCYLTMLGGAPAPSAATLGSVGALVGAFVIRLVNPWDGPGSEEIGWRGYALPRLQERYPPLTANLVLAAFVVTWHLRLVVNGSLPLVALIGTAAATILFGWLYNSTSGSLLLVYLFHAAEGVLKPAYGDLDASHYLRLDVAVWAVVALGVVIVSRRTLGSRIQPAARRTSATDPAVPEHTRSTLTEEKS